MIGNPDSTESLRSRPNAETTQTELLAVLARPLRRRVLHHLDTEMESIPLSELADRVADADEGRDPDDVAVALHHLHLPKLADCGLVEYDSRSNLVVPTFSEELELELDRFEP